MRVPSRRYISTRALSSIGRSPDLPPVIRIEDGTFYRDHPRNSLVDPSNPPLFPNFNFSLPSFSVEPQHWSIIGPSLSGKTTLLEVLRGQHLCFPNRARSFPYLSSEEIKRKNHRLRLPGYAIQYVGFGRGSAALGGSDIKGAYLSARYESRREETDFMLLDYLKGHTKLNPAEDELGSNDDDLHTATIIRELKLESLLSLPVGNLSNGQTRRARIARALLGKPEVLLLDEPFMGLDPPTVATLSPLLHRLAAANAPRLILSLRVQDPIPNWITHLIYLSSSAKVIYQGHKSGLTGELKERIQFMGVDSEHAAQRQDYSNEVVTTSNNKIIASTRSDVLGDAKNGSKEISGIPPYYMTRQQLDRERMRELHPRLNMSVREDLLRLQGVQDLGEFLVEMEGVKVQYGGQAALGGWRNSIDGDVKEGLYWSVRQGERWGIFGPNGSGKTTLLSLICSDHPQTYSLPIRIFGRSRLPQPGRPGISIFDLQARIGHSSPEVHNFFPRHLSVRRTLESAWAETFLGRPILNHERDCLVNACLRWFQVDLNPVFAHDPKHIGKVSGVTGTLGSEEHGPERAEQLQKLAFQGLPCDDLDWADNLRFGEIPFSAQRVALFLRAIIKKPDLVILDEAFSGMDDRLRDKCMLFLARGESRTFEDTNKKQEPKKRRGRRSKNGKETASIMEQSDVRLVTMKGLEDHQALICVSHVKEEVPGVVREWLCLPEPNEGRPPRSGRFKAPLSEDRGQWDEIWNPVR